MKEKRGGQRPPGVILVEIGCEIGTIGQQKEKVAGGEGKRRSDGSELAGGAGDATPTGD